MFQARTVRHFVDDNLDFIVATIRNRQHYSVHRDAVPVNSNLAPVPIDQVLDLGMVWDGIRTYVDSVIADYQPIVSGLTLGRTLAPVAISQLMNMGVVFDGVVSNIGRAIVATVGAKESDDVVDREAILKAKGDLQAAIEGNEAAAMLDAAKRIRDAIRTKRAADQAPNWHADQLARSRAINADRNRTANAFWKARNPKHTTSDATYDTRVRDALALVNSLPPGREKILALNNLSRARYGPPPLI